MTSLSLSVFCKVDLGKGEMKEQWGREWLPFLLLGDGKGGNVGGGVAASGVDQLNAAWKT